MGRWPGQVDDLGNRHGFRSQCPIWKAERHTICDPREARKAICTCDSKRKPGLRIQRRRRLRRGQGRVDTWCDVANAVPASAPQPRNVPHARHPFAWPPRRRQDFHCASAYSTSITVLCFCRVCAIYACVQSMCLYVLCLHDSACMRSWMCFYSLQSS